MPGGGQGVRAVPHGVAPVAALASAALADQQHASGQLAVRHLHRPKAQDVYKRQTYWIASNDQKSAGTIQAQVEAAVDAYESWQRKMGRDINPTELVYRVRAAGAKRVKLAAPADLSLIHI